jgi:MFS family permease
MDAPPKRGIFASPAFTRYFLGQSFSYVGDGLRSIAVPLLVFHLTGSALSTGGAFIAEITPFALLAVVGGSLADRTDRRRLMLACDAIRCAVMLAFGALFASGHLTVPLVYAGLVVISSCAAFFMGGQSSSIPFLIGKAGSTRAMSALITAEQTSNMIAPALGSAVFSFLGPLPTLFANAATYLASLFAIAGVPTLGPDVQPGRPSMRELIDDVKLGFRTLFGDAGMRAQAWIALALNTLGFGGYAILIPFLKHDFGASDTQVGIFFSISAAGAVCGSLLAGKIDRRWPFGRMLTIAYVLDALLFLPVVLTRNIWVAGSFWAVSNAFANFETTQIIGWRLRVIPERLIGRTFGAVRVFVLAGIAPGVFAAGWVADHVSPYAAMCGSTLGFILIAGIAVATPAIRNETR